MALPRTQDLHLAVVSDGDAEVGCGFIAAVPEFYRLAGCVVRQVFLRVYIFLENIMTHPILQPNNEVNTVTHHYLVTALWSSTCETDGRQDSPMDDHYSLEDFDAVSVMDAQRDCAVMLAAIKNLYWLAEYEKLPDAANGYMRNHTEEQIGHDLWLTRNGHGVGFWDRGMEEFGDALTAIAKAMGVVNVVEGDDGKLYIERV